MIPHLDGRRRILFGVVISVLGFQLLLDLQVTVYLFVLHYVGMLLYNESVFSLLHDCVRFYTHFELL